MTLRFAVAILATAVVITATLLSSQEAPPSPKKLILAEGTGVNLVMAQDISSRAARPGEPIELKLADDLKVGDLVVAKAGARALGEVVQGKKPDFWGEAGEVSIRVHFLRVGDKKVEIQGAIGAAGTRYIIARGSQGIIRTGTPVKAFVVADVEVTPMPDPPATGK
jgi:hypothetical protein